MPYTQSQDIFDVYRGTEELITDIAQTPIRDGHVYFAYDKDTTIPRSEIVASKLYFDANSHRFVVAGGGDVSFIKAHPAEDPIENLQYEYEFSKADIDAHKVNVDNIIITDNNVLYRVIRISDDGQTIYTKMIAGGGGGSGTDANPLDITVSEDFPDYCISSKAPSITVFLSSRLATINSGSLRVYCKQGDIDSTAEYVNVYELNKNSLAIVGNEVKITIPTQYFVKNSINSVKITINANDYSRSIERSFTFFEAAFLPVTWNPRVVFGTDRTSNLVQKTISYVFSLTGISTGTSEKDKAISGTIRTYIDDEEIDIGTKSLLYQGNNTVSFNCTDPSLSWVEHGNHTLRFDAFAVFNNEEYIIDSYSYDIMWATEEGGTTPIIISSLDENTSIVNYNVINIPYLIYLKNAEESLVHFYVNGEELRTSPRSISYSPTNTEYNNWRITEYVADLNLLPNSFTLAVDGTKVSRTFYVNIIPSELQLDAVSDSLLLYLSANDRSNKESLTSRKTWSYLAPDGLVYSAILSGFNWYNDGWQLDDEGVNVLRINNGSSVRIPFNNGTWLNLDQQDFTIEVEFKCRNALNYSKLLTLKEGVDEKGDPIVIKEINYEKDELGNETPFVANAVGQLFNSQKGLVFGTQEAFFAASNRTVNVRYADNNKVKISVTYDTSTRLLYIYINGVLSGVELCDTDTNFQVQAKELVFNSTYCDLDLYTIRLYNKALSFSEIVKNWYGDAPNLDVKLLRYEENNLTRDFTVLGSNIVYLTLDYEKTKAFSEKLAAAYIASGRKNGVRGLPIAVITTYENDELPFNKADKKSCGVRVYDPNGDFIIPYDKSGSLPTTDEDGEPVYYTGFKAQSVEFSVLGTSSQGYPRRNFKLKLKEYKGNRNDQLSKYPHEVSTWDGIEDHKDIWSSNTAAFKSYGFKKIKKLDIGNHTAETKFCWKADYMDSSSSHNTPLANYVLMLYQEGNGFDLRHPMNIVYDTNVYRTTVYGWPMLVFHERANAPAGTPLEFVGKYNFNTDKSAVGSFGFDIQKPHLVYLNNNEEKELPTEQEVEKIDSNGQLVYKRDENGNIQLDDNNNPIPETETVIKAKSRIPNYGDICECWELTSNQHGFTGFRRNDFKTVKDSLEMPVPGYGVRDFYNYWECRYFGADPEFDILDLINGKMTNAWTGKKITDLTDLLAYEDKVMENIVELSKWIYSTDVHPFENLDKEDADSHKLILVTKENPIKYIVDENDRTKITELLADYYIYTNSDQTRVMKLPLEWFSVQYTVDEATGEEIATVVVTNPNVSDDSSSDKIINHSLIYSDELNAKLAQSIFYHTRDENWDVTVDENDPSLIISVNKTYYMSNNDETSGIPITWYSRLADYIQTDALDENGEIIYEIDSETGEFKLNNKGEKIPVLENVLIGYHTVVNQPFGGAEIKITDVYEQYKYDTKEYRLNKYKDELRQHLNFDYMAAYFILTELFIMFDSREKNMMIATWGPEEPGGSYIWYPIFYDMDTQLGINNSGTVYWDYDVNAQDEGIFSGAGSVLWDNFYTCFLSDIRKFYINWRTSFLKPEYCIEYYNTNSADRWTPIMKNADSFYKYIGCTIAGIGYIDKDGQYTVDNGSRLYCAQGDRSLNRAAFFRNRFNYKDSEWLGGTYRKQSGKQIQMRYDANAPGTSDPDAATWRNDTLAQNLRADLNAEASFDITPYLTQYTSVYYDELAVSGGRYDIQNPPSEGYVKVGPLPSIGDKITQKVPLTQQLVYIMGAEYLRDLGDLSLKYLDELDLSQAIRLNRLILGNDNEYYRNDGATSASFNIDSPYYNGGTTVLNPTAKSLLQYIDLSNLSSMSGGVDFSGCLKLISLRALGSSLTSITIPEGNVLEILHLPRTITGVTIIQGLRLNKVVRDFDQCITAKASNGIASGLYIDNVTNIANLTVTEPIIAKYLNKETIPIDNYTKNNISTYRIEGGALGFNSYEILEQLIASKIQMYNDPNAVNYNKTLRIRLLDVNWTPYTLLDEDVERDSNTTYYIRTPENTYRELTENETFDFARKNLGGIYIKNDNRLLVDKEQNIYKEGIPNLNILQMLINDLQDDTKLIQDNSYIFMDWYQDPDGRTKYLPHIGGEIYVDNDEQHPIDEYTLYNIQLTYNANLLRDNTRMTICAKYVIPCPRVTFIEVNNDIQELIATYRSATAGSLVFDQNTPIIADRGRLHYDFRGWVPMSVVKDPSIGGGTFVDSDTGLPLAGTNSIVSKDSAVLNYLVDLNTLTYGEQSETYYAVFTLHEYKMTYVLDEELYESDPTNPKAYEERLVPSGSAISSNSALTIPWKTDDRQSLFTTYVFLGWGRKNDNKPINLSRQIALEDKIFYPIFTEDNIYNNPIPAEYINYVLINDQAYITKITKHLGGKICIPNYIDGHAVVSIYGVLISSGNQFIRQDIGGSGQFIEEPNGLQTNDDITHVFFLGANNNTATITSIGTNGLSEMRNLIYVDMPSSLTTLGQGAFMNDYKLSFTSLSYLINIEQQAFRNVNGLNPLTLEPVVSKLFITANPGLRIKNNSFNQSGWEEVEIGTSSQRWDVTYDQLQDMIFRIGAMRIDDAGINMLKGIKKIIIHFSNITKAEFLSEDSSRKIIDHSTNSSVILQIEGKDFDLIDISTIS